MKRCLRNIRPAVGSTDLLSDLQFLVIKLFFFLRLTPLTHYACYPTDLSILRHCVSNMKCSLNAYCLCKLCKGEHARGSYLCDDNLLNPDGF